jgi:hypothetical protein
MSRIGRYERDSEELCAIVDSHQASTDEKYQALIDIAVSLHSSLVALLTDEHT